jgi:hypothetical protein
MNLIFQVDGGGLSGTDSAAFSSLMIPAGSSSLRLFPESCIYWKGYLEEEKTKPNLSITSFTIPKVVLIVNYLQKLPTLEMTA